MDRATMNPVINFAKYLFISQNCNLACNAEKNTTVEDNKKRRNIANFINIYIYIYNYIPILYVTRMTKTK